MIPVAPQPEPADFDTKVRTPGRTWLKKHGIALDSAPPKASDLPNHWTHSNKQLWEAYDGVCAYLAIFFEWSTGAASTDHFVAKSREAGDAYEWDNYRLSCLGPNRNKSNFDDVLDPIDLQPYTFVLNLASGEISPNRSLPETVQSAATLTIQRLKLDSPENNEMRARHYGHYCARDWTLDFLRRESPFVHGEIVRQNLQ